MKQAFINLPNGRTYEISRKNPDIDLKDEEISALREAFSAAVSINLEVFYLSHTGDRLGLGHLALWGEVLKNSYITLN